MSYEVAQWNHIPIRFMPDIFSRKEVEDAIEYGKRANSRATENIPEDTLVLLGKATLDPKVGQVCVARIKRLSRPDLNLNFSNKRPNENLNVLMFTLGNFLETEFHKYLAQDAASK